MILTDEIIEQAARAIRDRPPATISGDYMMGRCRLAARAALESVLPGILEECAKVCDGEPVGTKFRTWAYMEGNQSNDSEMTKHSDALAAAIRNLKPKEEGNG